MSSCSTGHECRHQTSVAQPLKIFPSYLKSDNLVVQYIKLWHKIWLYKPVIFLLLLQKPCEWSCIHHRCTKLCYELCDREPCYKPCTKRLRCKHPCIGFCGETCPPLCRVCDKDEVTEMFFGTEGEPDARYWIDGWTFTSKMEDKLLNFVNVCSTFFNTSLCSYPCVCYILQSWVFRHSIMKLSVFLLRFNFCYCFWKSLNPLCSCNIAWLSDLS